MTLFPLILMAILAGWAVTATLLAASLGGRLRRERQEHAQAQERNARYRAALRLLEGKAAAIAARFEALQREHADLRQSVEARDRAPVERPLPTIVVDSLDISGEVGTLFEHVARVAVAIRNYSAYTRGHYGPEPNKARYDLLWLADCLHTFDRVGKALAAGSQRELAAASGELLSMYDMYLKDGSGYDSRDTFRRLAERVPLAGVTDAIRSIAMKTAPDPEEATGAQVPAAGAAPPVSAAAQG
ncbi:hypothetical protein [Pseudoxanthomonas broegbernensis]|uniref:hypothetical protein n=1 Tax=Pseudoxanthomonas broegbernensis TaxID=83619 RepID=UPI0017C4AFA4|nr:hypothetical protein [Pseudoxanthomonas broegbernensis]MBB6063778.1 hypothetical protein [Pseudoxanthomonas broegbernensis]